MKDPVYLPYTLNSWRKLTMAMWPWIRIRLHPSVFSFWSVQIQSRFLYKNSDEALTKSQQALSVGQDKRRLPLGDRIIRFLGWAGGFYSRKAVLTRSANSLYEQCIDDVDYDSFFKVCQMPDSFQSWFLVAQLHVWLCMARLKREEEDGKFLIHQIVSFFWKDVQERMKVLGVSSGYVSSESLRELDKEFRGLVIAYEEGLLTDDRRLAAAIWRNLVNDKMSTDPTTIAGMVKYIRSQVREMDGTGEEDIRKNGRMNLLPLSLSQTDDRK